MYYQILFDNYSAFGAETGQTPAHAPHSTQASASITYLPSPAVIAFTGHSLSQAPQAIHSSEITYAIFFTPPCVFIDRKNLLYNIVTTIHSNCKRIFKKNLDSVIIKNSHAIKNTA